MSVAGLPPPARVAPAPDEESGDAPAGAGRDPFSATLRDRVTQNEKEERLARRQAARAHEAAAGQRPPPPEHVEAVLAPADGPLQLAPVAPEGGGAAGGSGARAASADPAGADAPPPGQTQSGDADAAASAATPPLTVAPDFARLARLAARSGAPTSAFLPPPRASLPLNAAEARALASGISDAAATASRTQSRDGAHATPAAAALPAPTSSCPSAAAVDGSAKAVTVVNRPASGTLTIGDAARARLRQAASVVAGQAALRKGAVGVVDVPELGRIVVRADKNASGAVDVQITADRPETRGLLHASMAALTADLGEANVVLGQLVIDGPGAGSTAGDRGAVVDDIGRERSASRPEDSGKEASPGGTKRRVRIVL